MAVLNTEQRQFWREHGYIVVPNVVPAPLLEAVIETIEAFLGKDLADSETWYNEPMYSGGIINMSHHQSMWETRQYPRLHEAFGDIFGTQKLRVSLDRANMNPPTGPLWDNEGAIHWDMDSTARPLPFGVQGVLCLTDTLADQGGFQCVPGFHHRLEEWALTQPKDRPPMYPDTTDMETQHVAAAAGDLIIWHRALPHGNSRNSTDRPRLCQYITMSLANQEHQPSPMPLVRTPRAVVADALGVPEGLVEKWLRDQREADRVRVRADRVDAYELVPRLVRIEAGDRVLYFNKRLGQIVDAQTLETTREHAAYLELPIAAAAEGSAEQIRQIACQVPAPRFESRLSEAQLQKLPDLLAGGPVAQSLDGLLWNEDNLAQLMVRQFGLELDIQEAELTPLGRKLAGVDAW